MVGLCEDGNESSGSLKAICKSNNDREQKSRKPVVEMYANLVKDCLKLVAKMHYCIGRLQDGSLRFVRVGMRRHMWLAQVARPFVANKKLAASWVPHNLTEAQKWHRYATALLHLQRYHNEGDVFLQRVVAIDETWARAYEPELKRQIMLVVMSQQQCLLQRWDWEVLKHPPYSPDMSPCDYDLFPDIASVLHAVGQSIREITETTSLTTFNCYHGFGKRYRIILKG
ncbi:hypothetical protein ANN_18772 [Periplaneta americana]|uniref:Uncharacterized protein n=1 Tax=Periplaneta americana TaxID=6978 RepID=A0ABQ8SR03_PERAM|nr:hypothetical protein ANN_18772 [Periplaneta americana]